MAKFNVGDIVERIKPNGKKVLLITSVNVMTISNTYSVTVMHNDLNPHVYPINSKYTVDVILIDSRYTKASPKVNQTQPPKSATHFFNRVTPLQFKIGDKISYVSPIGNIEMEIIDIITTNGKTIPEYGCRIINDSAKQYLANSIHQFDNMDVDAHSTLITPNVNVWQEFLTNPPKAKVSKTQLHEWDTYQSFLHRDNNFEYCRHCGEKRMEVKGIECDPLLVQKYAKKAS